MARALEWLKSGAKALVRFAPCAEFAAQEKRRPAKDCMDEGTLFVAFQAGEMRVGGIIMSGIPGEVQYFVVFL